MSTQFLKTSFSFLFLCLVVYSNSQAQSVKEKIISEIFAEKFHPNLHSKESEIHRIKARSVEEMQYSDHSNPDLSEGEPYLTINPNNPNHIVASYMELDEILEFPIFYSFDGGMVWTRSEFNASEVFENDFTDQIIAGGGDPLLAFDDEGRLYFSWIYLGFEGLDGNVVTYWATSDDGGQTFEISDERHHMLEQGVFEFSSGEISGEGEGIFDRPWLGVDRSGGISDGALYCIGLFLPKQDSKLEGEGIVLRKKMPSVDSFQTVQLTVSEEVNAQFSNVVLDKNGHIHMSYVNLETSELIYANSIDEGESVLRRKRVALIEQDSGEVYVHGRENAAPSMAVCPITGNIYMTWTSFENAQVSGLFVLSKDFGNSWSEPAEIAELVGSDAKQIFMPGLMVNEKGYLVVNWFDLDTNDVGRYRMAFSDDRGAHFQNTFNVSLDTTEFKKYADGFTFFGDYSRSDFVGKFAHFIWSDGRNEAGAKVYYRKVDPQNPIVSNHFVSPISDRLNLGAVYKLESGNFGIPVSSKKASLLYCQIFNINGQLVSNWKTQINAGNETIYFPYTPAQAGQFVVRITNEWGQFARPFINY